MIVAAVHTQGTLARLVIADLSSGSAQVKSLASLPASDSEAVAKALEDAGVQRLIRVLPSASTIARTPALPEGVTSQGVTDTAIAGALSLLAETELPATLPEFRRVAGMLPVARTDARAALVPLVAGWPAPVPTDWSRNPWPCPEVWTPEIAALAAFARAAGGVDCAAGVDRSTGSASIVAAGPTRTLARVLKLSEPVGSSAARAIAETRAAGGLSPADPPSIDRDYTVSVHPSPRSGVRVGGRSLDASEIDAHAVAIGAVLLFADPSPNVRSLVGLHEREPRARAGLFERGVRALSSPLRAGIVLAACLAVLLAAPLAVAYARYATLSQRTKDDAGLSERIRTREQELAFYKLLREKRWPMTKLIADVAGAAPVGVTLDAIELSHEGGTLNARGVADSSDLVTTFRENLAKTKVFSQVTTPSIGAASDAQSKIQFQLTAKVPPGAATYAAPPIDDFAARPMVERLYGPGAGAVPRTRSERAERSERPSRSTSSRPERSGSSTPAPSTAPSASGSRTPAKPADIPKPLSDEQIAKLTRAQAMIEWAKRKSAATQPGISEADKIRLQEESEKAKRRMDELKNQGPQSSRRSPEPTPHGRSA